MANSFASSTLAATVGLLKNYYADAIVSQFNDEVPLYKAMEKGKDKAAGLQVIRAVKTVRNQGLGWTTDGGVLPSIGTQTTTQATIPFKYGYLRFGLTGPMLAASKNDKGAFASVMEYEMSEGLKDFISDFNRGLFYNGNGNLATVSANAVSSTVITVTGRESTEDGSQFLSPGMAIDVYSGTTKVASNVIINSLTGTTTATLTLNAAVTVSANDIVVRANNYGNEVNGLYYTLDGATSSIYGINRATYPQFQGNVVTTTGQLNLDLLQQTWNLGKKRGGAKYDAIYCDFDSERFYNKLLVADKRYVGRVAGDGTFSSKEGSYLEFAGIKVTPDKDSPRRFWFVDSSTWKKYELGDPLHWVDESGSVMFQQQSADAFEVRLRHMCNIFCEKPSANAVLSGYLAP